MNWRRFGGSGWGDMGGVGNVGGWLWGPGAMAFGGKLIGRGVGAIRSNRERMAW